MESTEEDWTEALNSLETDQKGKSSHYLYHSAPEIPPPLPTRLRLSVHTGFHFSDINTLAVSLDSDIPRGNVSLDLLPRQEAVVP